MIHPHLQSVYGSMSGLTFQDLFAIPGRLEVNEFTATTFLSKLRHRHGESNKSTRIRDDDDPGTVSTMYLT